ncbi:MAG: c-type cytochrome [Verrucomicrobia bacterium]|nr:c-type cytochrome [Verrucomicrobiota bacterium]
MNRQLAFLIALLAAGAKAEPYRLEEITLPAAMSPEISAVEFSPTGRLVVANRHGEIWSCDPARRDWVRFAYGLHEPMGLYVAADHDVYVGQRPELTRVRDTTGDGVADRYETVNAEWGITDNWHEFVFGPRRDHEGNFVLAIGLPDTAGAFNQLHSRTPIDLGKIAREAKPSAGPWQGWVFKVTPAGKLVPWASGFRQAAGVGVSPEGEIFVTDQQGDYIAASPLIHVRRGRFYGHPASLKWAVELDGRKPAPDQLEAMRTPPTVVLPHGSIGGSPGDPVWDTTGGRFGPFAGQVFIGDFTKLISRVDLELVAGEYQGACFPFLRDATGVAAILSSNGANNLTVPAGTDGQKYFRDAPPLQGTRLRQGNMRLGFAPDGSLYLGQTTRGWASGDGLQRLVWTGETPVEIHTMRLTPRGFALGFTTPMDRAQLAQKNSYRVERFRYLYHSAGGSPRVDQSNIAVVEASVSADGRRADLVLAELDPGYIYQLEVDGLRSSAGVPVANPLAYYTVNRLHSGRTFTGPLSRPLFAAVPRPARDRANTGEGRRVYLTFCVACHQADGRGGGLPGFAAADFVGEKTRLGKGDDELLGTIASGIEAKGMPSFGQVLSQEDRQDVLAFLREAFGTRAANTPP